MESVDLQMEDIFGDGDDDPFASHADIPDLPPDHGVTDQPVEGQNIENDAVLARLRDLSRGAATRTVKRVQPKLDPARLTGDRGIGVLPKIFKDVKFKGKGHEAEDLKKVMRYLEHWTHRLFPKMPFDEVLQRIEKLGTKKEVQTYIKRMRMDMPVDNDDKAINEADDEILDNSADKTGEEARVGSIGAEEEEVLDEIMREEEEHRARQSQLVNHSCTSASVTASQSASSSTGQSQLQATPTTSTPSTPGDLTAEQRERMEANKRKAQERRLAKLGHRTPGTPSGGVSVPVNTPLAYPATPSTDQSVSSLHQSSTASPLVVDPRGDHSPSKVPKLDLAAESEQLTEDQLLADLEEDDIKEPTLDTGKIPSVQRHSQDDSLSPLRLDATETLSQNTATTSEVTSVKSVAAESNTDVNNLVTMDMEETAPT